MWTIIHDMPKIMLLCIIFCVRVMVKLTIMVHTMKNVIYKVCSSLSVNNGCDYSLM